MSEWKEYKLGNFGTVITGNTPSSKNPEDWGDEMLFITPSDYKNYLKYANCSDRKLSSIGFNRLNKKILPPNSLLVTCIGSDMGKVVKASDYCITNQQINSIIPNDKFDSDFIYYKLIDLYGTLRIYGGDGTAVPIVNKSDFENIVAEVPENKEEQERIAGVLNGLDAKIDLLDRQNTTLEAMAETLFRQYFIENPKEEWKPATLGKYVICTNGVSYKSDDLNASTTAMATLKSFNRDGGFKLDGYKEYTGGYKPNQTISEGDLLVAHTDITQDAAVIGNPALVISDPQYNTLIFSMDLVKVEPIDCLSREVLYLLMKSTSFKEHCLGYANGSTVLHLSKKAIPEFEFIMPTTDIVEKLQKGVAPLVDKLFANHKQILTLAQLRDTLLPKLMNNGIRIDG